MTLTEGLIVTLTEGLLDVVWDALRVWDLVGVNVFVGVAV